MIFCGAGCWLLSQQKSRLLDLEAFAEDIAQQSVLKVLEKQETFLGQSQFLTWATKVAIRIGLSELRHARWKETSLDRSSKRTSLFQHADG